MKKYFFDNVFEAIIYLIFLSLMPLISIIAQFMVSDKTMYVSCLVAGFAMTYDYVILFKANVCERLWREALVAAMCLLVSTIISIVRLIYLLLNSATFTYTMWDMGIIILLAVMCLINLYEFIIFARFDYNARYESTQSANYNNFTKGMSKV